MKLTINTTPEQDEALTALNLISNPKAQPPLDVFATSELTGHLDAVVVLVKNDNLTEARVKLEAVATKLTAQDLAQLTAIAEKYAS